MPRVPTLNSSVQEQGFSGLKRSTDQNLAVSGGGDAAAGMARAAQGALSSIDKVALEAKQRADDTLTQKAYSEFIKRKNEKLWNPEAGAFAKKGESAIGVTDEYLPQLEKDADDIEENLLQNNEQRSIFRKMRERELLEVHGQLSKHSFREAEAFAEQTAKATISTLIEDSVVNYHETGKVESNLAKQEALILSRSQGKSEEQVQMELSQVRSGTHSAVIERMLSNGQDLAAQSYFKQHKDQFGLKTADVEKALEESSLRGASQRQSDAIFRKSPDMTTALQQAKGIQDPKLRDAVTERLKDQFALRERAEKQDVEDLHRAATDVVDKTGSVDEIPPQQWARFSLSERSALKNYAKHRRDGTEPETDWNEYYNLRTMASSPDLKGEFLTTNLMPYRSKMADTEFKQLVDLQADMRKGSGKSDKMLDDWRTEDSIVKETLAAAGIDPSPKEGTDASRKVALFRSKVADEVRRYQERTGKKALNEDYERIAGDMIVKGVTEKGWIWDTRKRRFEIEPNEAFEVEPTEIPKTERSRIIEALKRNGRPVTEQAIANLYNNKVKRSAQSER